MEKGKSTLIGLLIAAAFSISNHANAAEVSVSKLRINLEASQNADFVVLQNQSETDKQSYEISLKKWSQKTIDKIDKNHANYSPENIYEETKNVSISPKTITISPKAEKVVRVIINDRAKSEEDASYRLFITQLPSKDLKVEKNTVNLLFKISIPVFVLNEPIKKAEKFSLERRVVEIDGKKFLFVKNNDKQHIQIQGISKNKEKAAGNTSSLYLLPNVSANIEIPEESYASQLFMQTDKGLIEINVK